MDNHELTIIDVADILGKEESIVHEILSYKRYLSSDDIRKLAGRFKVRREAFNGPYELK